VGLLVGSVVWGRSGGRGWIVVVWERVVFCRSELLGCEHVDFGEWTDLVSGSLRLPWCRYRKLCGNMIEERLDEIRFDVGDS